METYLYYSLVPEALIASQLPPEKFGQYYATGYEYKSKGQALFFDVDPARLGDYFDLDAAFARCVTHPDGRPKSSVYVSTYRVLEHIPVSALGTLHLTTAYGATLGLERATGELPTDTELHLYKELAPVNSPPTTSRATTSRAIVSTVMPMLLRVWATRSRPPSCTVRRRPRAPARWIRR